MVGLLDPNNLPDLAMVAGLLQGRNPNWPMMLHQLAAQKEKQKRDAEMLKMQQESHALNQRQGQMQIGQMERQQGIQDQLGRAASEAFRPPQEAHGPMPEGLGAPMLPGGGGMNQFAQDAMRIDPLGMGLKVMPKPGESPLAKIDPKDYTPESFQAFVASGMKNPGVLVPYRKPEGPQKGQTREVKTGGKIFTYEFDGKEWKKIADAPQWKPEMDGPEKAPTGYRWSADRSRLEAIPGGPAEKQPKDPGEAELTAAGYAGRMAAAEGVINTVGPAGFPSPRTAIAANLPKLGPGMRRAAERAVMTPEQQQFRQAQEDWVRAKLRKESGAVIAEDEMQREIETYFPQLWELNNPKVIQQKARARATAIAAMTTAAGKAKNTVEQTANARPPLESFQQ